MILTYWFYFFSYKRLLHTQSTAVSLKISKQQNKLKKKKKKGNLTEFDTPYDTSFPQGSVSLPQDSSEVVQAWNQRSSESVAVWEQAVDSPVGWGWSWLSGDMLCNSCSILQDCSSVLNAHCFCLPSWQPVFSCKAAYTFVPIYQLFPEVLTQKHLSFQARKPFK